MMAPTLDAILVLVVVEAVLLVAYNRRTRRGIPAHLLLGNLVAGFCLMVALRLSLGTTRHEPTLFGPLGAALFAALVAHVFDLVVRWRDRP